MTNIDLDAARKAAEETAERRHTWVTSKIDTYGRTEAILALDRHASDLAAMVLKMADEIERLRNPKLLDNLAQWDILPGGTYEPAFIDRMHAISAALGEAQKMKEEIARLREDNRILCALTRGTVPATEIAAPQPRPGAQDDCG